MKGFKTTDLLAVLIALIELQIFAVEAKRKCPASAALKYLDASDHIHTGICFNAYRTPSRLPCAEGVTRVLVHIIRQAPCNASGGTAYPVNSPFPEKTRHSIYDESAPLAMWGDHPYADNRRQLIAEMITQLQDELKARGYKL